MKVIYDTCLYVDFLRSGSHKELFTDRHFIRYLSPVVMMELLAGASSPKQKSTLEKLFRPYLKAHRLINLGAREFVVAGQTLANMRKSLGHIKPGFSHDILIAISAQSIGATLFTSNAKDFNLIKKVIPIKHAVFSI